jgi:hypothetical protein
MYEALFFPLTKVVSLFVCFYQAMIYHLCCNSLSVMFFILCFLAAIEAIFTSEKVQDIVPISKDSVLILGQGNMFLYGTS